MRTWFRVLLPAVVSSMLVSCSINAPTSSSEIPASPVSELKYADHTCASLTAVLESLAWRNLDPVRAQNTIAKLDSVEPAFGCSSTEKLRWPFNISTGSTIRRSDPAF